MAEEVDNFMCLALDEIEAQLQSTKETNLIEMADEEDIYMCVALDKSEAQREKSQEIIAGQPENGEVNLSGVLPQDYNTSEESSSLENNIILPKKKRVRADTDEEEESEAHYSLPLIEEIVRASVENTTAHSQKDEGDHEIEEPSQDYNTNQIPIPPDNMNSSDEGEETEAHTSLPLIEDTVGASIEDHNSEQNFPPPNSIYDSIQKIRRWVDSEDTDSQPEDTTIPIVERTVADMEHRESSSDEVEQVMSYTATPDTDDSMKILIYMNKIFKQ